MAPKKTAATTGVAPTARRERELDDVSTTAVEDDPAGSVRTGYPRSAGHVRLLRHDRRVWVMSEATAEIIGHIAEVWLMGEANLERAEAVRSVLQNFLERWTQLQWDLRYEKSAYALVWSAVMEDLSTMKHKERRTISIKTAMIVLKAILEVDEASWSGWLDFLHEDLFELSAQSLLDFWSDRVVNTTPANRSLFLIVIGMAEISHFMTTFIAREVYDRQQTLRMMRNNQPYIADIGGVEHLLPQDHPWRILLEGRQETIANRPSRIVHLPFSRQILTTLATVGIPRRDIDHPETLGIPQPRSPRPSQLLELLEREGITPPGVTPSPPPDFPLVGIDPPVFRPERRAVQVQEPAAWQRSAQTDDGTLSNAASRQQPYFGAPSPRVLRRQMEEFERMFEQPRRVRPSMPGTFPASMGSAPRQGLSSFMGPMGRPQTYDQPAAHAQQEEDLYELSQIINEFSNNRAEGSNQPSLHTQFRKARGNSPISRQDMRHLAAKRGGVPTMAPGSIRPLPRQVQSPRPASGSMSNTAGVSGPGRVRAVRRDKGTHRPLIPGAIRKPVLHPRRRRSPAQRPVEDSPEAQEESQSPRPTSGNATNTPGQGQMAPPTGFSGRRNVPRQARPPPQPVSPGPMQRHRGGNTKASGHGTQPWTDEESACGLELDHEYTGKTDRLIRAEQHFRNTGVRRTWESVRQHNKKLKDAGYTAESIRRAVDKGIALKYKKS